MPILSNSQKELFSNPENVEAKVRSTYEHYVSYCARDVKLNESMRLWFSGYQSTFTNAVTFSSYPDEKTASQAVLSVKEQARLLNVPMEWWVTPTTKPTTMAKILKAHNFCLLGKFSAMIYFLDELSDTHKTSDENIVIKKLSDPDQISEWAGIIGLSFEYDESLTQFYTSAVKKAGLSTSTTEHYIGYYKGELAATATLFVNENWAGVYDIATHPFFRKRGIATQILFFLLKRAQELGLSYVVLMSEPRAKGLYSKVGFKDIFDIDIYWLKN